MPKRTKRRGPRNSGRPSGRPAGRGTTTAALLQLIGGEAERIKAAHPGFKDAAIAREISERGIPSSLPSRPIRMRTMSVDTIRKCLPAARREYAELKKKMGFVDLPAPKPIEPLPLPGGLLDGLSKLGSRD